LFVQVAILLYLAYILIHWMWQKGIDPDSSAIPYLTSMGDLLGISLLAAAFQALYLLGEHELDSDYLGSIAEITTTLHPFKVSQEVVV